MRRIIELTILLIFTLTACSGIKSTDADSGDFYSRIHTTDLETDWYKTLGKTTLNKHLDDLKTIEWKKEYWKEDSAETFNFPDLEVMDRQNSKYLSISVCPNTHESFQFYVGLGTHIEVPNNGRILRSVRLYGTETDKPDKAIALLKLFFERDFAEIDRQLKTLVFFEEIDDVYQNIEKE